MKSKALTLCLLGSLIAFHCSADAHKLLSHSKARTLNVMSYGNQISKTDNIRDQKEGFGRHLDIETVRIFPETDLGTCRIYFWTGAPLPTNKKLDLKFQIGFDTDSDKATGVLFEGQTGTDKIVTFAVKGKFKFENIDFETILLPVEVMDTLSKKSTRVKDALQMKTSYTFYCPVKDGGEAHAAPSGTAFTIDVDSLLLDIIDETPFVIASLSGSTIVDTMSVKFDTDKTPVKKIPTFDLVGTQIPVSG